MFKKEVESTRSGADFIFSNFSRAEGGGRMLPTQQVWGKPFWRELICLVGRGAS